MTSIPRPIDLRSDTVTRPTEQMYAAMLSAVLGDDGYGDDPDVSALEKRAAAITGKAAAVFLPSGTMANLTAVLASARPGGHVISEATSHVIISELEGASVLGRQELCPIEGSEGRMNIGQLRARLDAMSAPSIVCVENTHTASGGRVLDLEHLQEIRRAVAGRAPIHLDGARLFNAVVRLQRDPAELCEFADSVTIALSKGLSAPAGSVLCGTEEMIGRARKFRKMLGGGMRQTGILASAGLVALDTMIERLADDHKRARVLAGALAAIVPGSVSPDAVETNIILCNSAVFPLPVREVAARLSSKGVLARIANDGALRFVLHRHIGDEELATVIRTAADVIATAGAPTDS